MQMYFTAAPAKNNPKRKRRRTMNISNEEYGELTKQRSNNSKMTRTIPMAFVVGGLICTLGEALLNVYAMAGLSRDDSAALTSMTLVFLSILFTVASPALDFKSEGYVLGLGAKMFVIAGPVIVYGISASVIYGIIYYIVGLFMK